jgi:hypothetical protein
VAYSIAVDSGGNVCVAGQYAGTLTVYNPNLTTGPTTKPTTAAAAAFIVKLDTNGYAQWAATAATATAGTAGELANSVTVDSSNNIYVTGQTGVSATTVATYSSNGSAFGTTITTSGGDAFTVKYDTSGNVQWIARVSSTAFDGGLGIATDSGGNVYISGRYGAATATAYSSNGVAFGTTLTSIGGGDAFLVKYNSSGTVQWVAKMGNTLADLGYGVAIDSADNVYITGQSGAGVTFTAFSSNNVAFGTTLAGIGGGDVFLVKYNSSGTVQWVARMGSTLAEIGYAVATDSSNNVYLTGRYTGTMTAYSSNGTAFGTTISNPSTYNTYLAKYDSGGTVLWLTSFVASESSEGRGIDVDLNGNVCVVGTFRSIPVTLYSKPWTVASTIPAPSGGLADAYAIKYSTNGVPQWYVRVASTSTETGRAIKCDIPNDAFYMAGRYGAAATAYNSDGTSFGTTLSLVGTNPAFLVKYNTAGVVQWHTKLTHANGAEIWGLATDSTGNVFATGTYGTGGNLTAYNSSGTAFATTLANAGSNDAFIVKYNSSGSVQWLARCISCTALDEAWSTAVDGYGQPYVIGSAGSGAATTTVTVYNADGTAYTTYSVASSAKDTFIVKYDSSTGQVVFSTRITGATAISRNGLRIAINPRASLNFFYVVGTVASSTDTLLFYHQDGSLETRFNQTYSGAGAFVAQYYVNGYVSWTAKINPTRVLVSSQHAGCAVDNAGNVYMATLASQSAGVTVFPLYNADGTRFGMGFPGSTAPGSTMLLVKYNQYGYVEWMSRVVCGDATGSTGMDIACDSGGNVYICGQSGTSTTSMSIYDSDGNLSWSVIGSVPLVKYDTYGFVKWIQRGNANPESITVDRNNDVYITGSTTSALTIIDTDAISRLNNFDVRSNGAACVVKLSSSAAPLWLARIQSFPSTAIAYSSALDSSGNTYLAGSAAAGSTVVAYSANGSAFGTTIGNSGGTDAFVAKYDTNGTVQWIARIASAGADVGYGIATDSSGNAYVIGSGVGTVTAYSSNGTAFGTTLPDAGTGDAFLVKYNTNGTVQWVARIASTATDTGYGISTDSSANVYVTGAAGAAVVTSYSSNGAAFSPTLASAGLGDVFIVKYNTSGTVQWNARIASTATDIGYATATDSAGNVYITGQGGSAAVVTAYNSSGTAFATTLANAGSNDAFIVKYNSSGSVQWVARIATTGTDVSYSITTDSSSNVYVTGLGGSGLTITAYNSNGTAFATTLTDSGNGAAFLVKYNTTGTVQWVAKVDGGLSDIGYAVTTDSSGNLYMGGQTQRVAAAYHSTNVLYGSPTVRGTGSTTQGFLVKYNSSGTVQWIIDIGGGGSDSIRSVRTDSSANIYVTGTFAGSSFLLNSV